MSRQHRRRSSAASHPPSHSFSAADALEAYHTEIVDIEAYAHAAGEAVTHLPHTTNPKFRRIFARIYTLVSKVAVDLTAAVRHGDKLIAELSKYPQSRPQAEPTARRPELPTRRADDE